MQKALWSKELGEVCEAESHCAVGWKLVKEKERGFVNKKKIIINNKY